MSQPSHSHSHSQSKKRKHAPQDPPASQSSARASTSSGSYITVNLSEDSNKSSLKPLLATTPSVALPPETSFTLYRNSVGSKREDKGKGRSSSMLHGESTKLEWSSSNRLVNLDAADGAVEDGAANDDEAGGGGAGSEYSAAYALALYDPSNDSLSLIKTPLHILSHIPKRLKALPSLISNPAQSNNAIARAELGLSFGTKKSIKAIRAAERNKVDAGAQDLQSVQDVLMSNLDEGLESMPAASASQYKPGQEMDQNAINSEYAAVAARNGRPVPNVAAERPEDVYKIVGGIVTDKEYEGINVHLLTKVEPQEKERAITMLPYRGSTWINDRVKEMVVAGNSRKDKRKRLKLLAYMSVLMQLYKLKGGVDPSQEDLIKKKFGGAGGYVIPPEVVKSVLERFAETVRGTRNYKVTPTKQSNLACYIFVLALYLDNYQNVDMARLANDISLAPRKATEIFKSLGCQIATPRGTELEKILVTWRNEGKTTESDGKASDGARLKVANLKIPLEFPRERRKAPAKR